MFFSIHTQRADQPKPAIFLDRDGTIDVGKNYSIKLRIESGFLVLKRRLNSSNKQNLVVVVSNQAGIALGKYGPEDVDRLGSA